jgi:DNA-binding transcriptional ArsR family regulator
VLQLLQGQHCVHELVAALSLPQPLVSQHLRVLKAAGVVAGRRSGREVFSASWLLRERLSPRRATSMVISMARRGSRESEWCGGYRVQFSGHR